MASPTKDSSAPAPARWRKRSKKRLLPAKDGDEADGSWSGVLPARPQAAVPTMEPLVCTKVHCEPLSAVVFAQDAMLTASVDGELKVWNRPEKPMATAV